MSNKITFWNFIRENNIEIPIIQRDYAQGRLGREYLRKNFLEYLRSALKEATSDKPKKIDFVYGSTENNKLKPLDGQQRLTTLWLLHWYIALMSGNLKEEVVYKTLAKFTYETRISSREFCQNLCNPENFTKYQDYKPTKEGRKIVEYITSRTWFYSAWKQDPTIQSMLRMLGGTETNDKKGDDIIDGIEELFAKTTEKEYEDYWEKLTKQEIIVFYHLPLQDFGLSDDLYIKMNARGKQLTSFENFKADLIGYISKQSKDETLEEKIQKEWEKLLHPENGMPIKLDTVWTDIFWRNKSNENKIDEIYFAFINRFFLQELICAKKEDKKSYLFSAKDLEEKNDSFKYLYGNKSDDSQLLYSGLEKYLYQTLSENSEKAIPLSLFKKLQATLNNYKSENIKHFSEWVVSNFEFIPIYGDKNQISTLGQKERVVFLAVCRYFGKGCFEDTSFKQWMRVVWNIVENSGIDMITAMIGAMRLIDELSEHSHNIYTFLSNHDSKIESEFAKEQVAEERAKAKKIIEAPSWETKIIDAEKYAFFKGAIRFLFSKETIGDDWEHFDIKWQNAQFYFDLNGVKDGLESDKLYKTNSLLMKYLLANCDDWGKISWFFEFSNDAIHWKNILTSSTWRTAVDAIMGTEITDDITSKLIAEINDQSKYIKNIVDDGLMNYVCNEMSGAWIRSTYHGYQAIWKSGHPSSQIVLNPILAQLKYDKKIDYCENNSIGNCRYYKCVDRNVDFKYKNHFFRWWGNPNEKELDIYLMEKDWMDYKKRTNYEEGKLDKDNHYCFRVTPDMESKTSLFIEELDRLIDEASQNS